MSQDAEKSIIKLHAIVCSYALSPLQLCKALGDIGEKLKADIHGVMVCNGAHPLPPTQEKWQFIRGSNQNLDFSAYMEGAAHLMGQGFRPPCTLVLNDSTFTKHNAFRVLKTLLAYRAPVESAKVPAIAGKTDPYDNVCYASPWSGLGLYVSSFCFLLNSAALPLLVALPSEMEADLGSADVDIASEHWGPHLTMQFREYLRAHLVHPGNSVSWYQLSRHSSNRELLARKARCVYLEHRLSGEIGKRGLIFSLYPRLRMKTRFFFFEQLAKVRRRMAMPG